MRQYFILPIAVVICCLPFSTANAITSTRLTPKEARCTNIGGSARIFPQSYSYGSFTRRVKAGIQHSSSCNWS
jgi:hypothetical protein